MDLASTQQALSASVGEVQTLRSENQSLKAEVTELRDHVVALWKEKEDLVAKAEGGGGQKEEQVMVAPSERATAPRRRGWI